ASSELAMRVLHFVAILPTLFVSASASHQSEAKSAFVGTWRLMLFEQDSAGALLRRGAHPTGYLYYDASGHMAAQIQPERKRASWPHTMAPTAEQALDAATGYIAYFGTYTVNEE